MRPVTFALEEIAIMRSGLISLLVFIVFGPPIGLTISLHGDFEALLYIAFIIFGYIFGGPIAALSSVFFIVGLAVVLRCPGITKINPSFGAVIGGASGVMAMALLQFVDGDIFKNIELYVVCGFSGAICGAVRCFYPIILEKRFVG